MAGPHFSLYVKWASHLGTSVDTISILAGNNGKQASDKLPGNKGSQLDRYEFRKSQS